MFLTPRWLICASLLLVAAPYTGAQMKPAASRLAALKQLSLDQLLSLEISTVSRKEERWWAAPSGIDVVTGEEIRRSGAMNIPDALRLATGVHVGHSSSKSWAVSLRGMNVLAANKISVAMDGRSLFTPFFSGVQWDAQDTLMDDIDRIEVVRGPVGSLWGAFAVNGFIQILTKPAWDTQSWLASAGGGTEDPGFASFRYGGTIGNDTFYRVYAKYSQTDWTYARNGRHAQTATDFFQTGFRADVRRPQDTTLTLQGDYYTNQDLSLDRAMLTEIAGANLLGRWRRAFSPEANLEVQTYFDHTYRLLPLQFEERRNTASASIKHHTVQGRHDWLFGIDGLVSWDDIGNIGIAHLEPSQRRTHNLGAFLQDTVQLVPERTALTLGLKVEHNSFSGFDYQPTARLAWTPNPKTTVWSALSRAIRTPVRVDEDLVFRFAGVPFFEANDDFETEVTLAYEIGMRHQPTATLTFDVSVFVYDYENLRSTEPAGIAPTPLTFKNRLNSRSHGGELAIMYQPMPRLFFKGSYRYLDLEFFRDPGSRDTTNGSAEGNDPKHVANLGVHIDFAKNWEFDAFLRHASALPNPVLPGYTALDLRLGWRPSQRWDLSLSARDLLDRQHPEFITTNSLNEEVHRRFTLKATWRY
jgi:iron complex outermembrane receptor protein